MEAFDKAPHAERSGFPEAIYLRLSKMLNGHYEDSYLFHDPTVVREFDSLIESLLSEPAIAEALVHMTRIPDEFGTVYHTKEYTLDVISETVFFALMDGAPWEVAHQQAISAAWHDVGFLKQPTENESLAIDLFRESHAFKELPKSITAEVAEDIWNTRVITRKDGSRVLDRGQSTYGYALDGDVSNFGRHDFFDKMQMIAQERKLDLSDMETRRRFYEDTLNLLKNHSWQSDSAFRLREKKKIENMAELQNMLDEMSATAHTG